MQTLHPHAVGHLLNKKVPTVSADSTIADLLKTLEKNSGHFKTIHTIYVLAPSGHLIGAISMIEVFRNRKTARMSSIMSKKLVTVHPQTTRERAAYLALQHRIKEVPIVDENGLFLGVFSGDDILQTVYRETSEDLLRLGGIHHDDEPDNILTSSVYTLFKHRFPWLFLGLLGGVLTAQIVSGFEAVLERNVILAAFIPLVVYIADAVGTQMEAFIIRDLAMDPRLRFWRYLRRQLSVTFLIGAISAVVLYAFSAWWYQDTRLALTISIAIFGAIVSSVFTGLIVPYTLSRLKTDPANASGPLATILQDILSILIYFLIATWLL